MHALSLQEGSGGLHMMCEWVRRTLVEMTAKVLACALNIY